MQKIKNNLKKIQYRQKEDAGFRLGEDVVVTVFISDEICVLIELLGFSA